MKKVLILCFSVLLAFSMVACSMGNNNPTTSENDNTTNGHVNSGNAQDGTINQGNDDDGVVSEIVSDSISMTESMVSKTESVASDIASNDRME